MTTITDKKQYPGEQYLNELITNIEFAARAPVEVVRAMAAELQKRREADSAEPVSQTYKFPVNTPCQDAPAHIWLQTAGVWPENGELSELTWCSHNQHHDDTLYVRADLVNGNYPVTPARLPGGFTIEDAKALHEDLVRSHISQALSGEKMKKNDRDADLRWIHGVIVQAAWFVKASLEQNALSGNSRLIPGEVLSAIREVAKIRADFDDFDGDRRGIGDCLDEAEQELIVTINKYASQLAAEPIAPNDVREQTAIPQVPVTPDGWISCSERMPEDTKMLLAFSQGEIVAAYWNWVVNPIDYKKYRAFTYLSGNILDDVTHWMPLPEPPQEVK
ncbi:TPA: DUF551 domain-containing protein [Escherichia coli]